jgi:uncharacterized damage-inducible protein DinB
MRAADLLTLLDYNAWANRQVVDTAGELSIQEFTEPSGVTWRNVRGTLVHTLDVERSWRRRLQGRPPEEWDDSLHDEDYPTADALAEHWDRDHAEMRAWIEGLDDEAVGAIVDLGEKDRFPLWYFVVHVLTHSAQQRRDAAILLTNAGHGPPEIEFLYYADWLRDRARSRPR